MDMDRISQLPEEILAKIVDHIQPDPERLVPVYYRRFLSVESIEIPPRSNADRDIRQFRRTCKRFAEVGQPALFSVISIDFSTKGLTRLEDFLAWTSNVARHVKRFSYMVHYSYKKAEHIFPSSHRYGLDHKTLSQFRARADEQKRITANGDDVRVLAAALKSFTSLQVVKLLRVSDHWDDQFKRYIKDREGLEEWAEKYWAPSCTEASRAIGRALLRANVRLNRFYIPAVNVQSLRQLNRPSPQSLPQLAARLTCLTLVFDDGHDLDERISELSALFKKVFTAAEHMQAIHIGFPRHRPFNHPLEDVFHHVTWTKLLAFGVAGWCLHANEIIDLATRHRERLKGLRLRDVSLKGESRWKDVLLALKTEMEVLEWLSLRRVGYDNVADEIINGGGMEVSDDSGLESSTDEHEGPSDEDVTDVPEAGASQNHANGYSGAHDDSDAHHSSDEDDGPTADETEFPQAVLTQEDRSPDRIRPRVKEAIGNPEVNLEDDGRHVSRQQQKMWEEWVVRRR